MLCYAWVTLSTCQVWTLYVMSLLRYGGRLSGFDRYTTMPRLSYGKDYAFFCSCSAVLNSCRFLDV